MSSVKARCVWCSKQKPLSAFPEMDPVNIEAQKHPEQRNLHIQGSCSACREANKLDPGVLSNPCGNAGTCE